jgi:hypothetical protein
MHRKPERGPAPLLLAVAVALATPQALAGILYGIDYHSYNGRSGHPEDSDVAISRTGFFGAYCANGAEAGGRRMIYPLDVPDGFEIFDVHVWGDDSSVANDLGLRIMESCQPFLEGGLPSTTPLATATTSGSDGEFSLSLFADQYPVQDSTCAYWLEARFAADDTACDGINLALTRFRVLVNNPDVIFRDHFGP